MMSPKKCAGPSLQGLRVFYFLCDPRKADGSHAIHVVCKFPYISFPDFPPFSLFSALLSSLLNQVETAIFSPIPKYQQVTLRVTI